MKTLIIEDDLSLANNLKKTLIKEGFAVDIAPDKEKGLTETEVNEYDCIILDINLPDGNGFEIIQHLREKQDKTPIIIVTARGNTPDKIKGLNLGADDYVQKPVDSHELIARIRAIIRRNSTIKLPIITIGDLKIIPAQHKAFVKGKKIELTAKEFSVLEYLALHSNQAITRTMLMEHIWDSDFEVFSNVIDVYIKNLRRKIEKHTNQKLIKTVRGKGYILTTDED